MLNKGKERFFYKKSINLDENSIYDVKNNEFDLCKTTIQLSKNITLGRVFYEDYRIWVLKSNCKSLFISSTSFYIKYNGYSNMMPRSEKKWIEVGLKLKIFSEIRKNETFLKNYLLLMMFSYP